MISIRLSKVTLRNATSTPGNTMLIGFIFNAVLQPEVGAEARVGLHKPCFDKLNQVGVRKPV